MFSKAKKENAIDWINATIDYKDLWSEVTMGHYESKVFFHFYYYFFLLYCSCFEIDDTVGLITAICLPMARILNF